MCLFQLSLKHVFTSSCRKIEKETNHSLSPNCSGYKKLLVNVLRDCIDLSSYGWSSAASTKVYLLSQTCLGNWWSWTVVPLKRFLLVPNPLQQVGRGEVDPHTLWKGVSRPHGESQLERCRQSQSFSMAESWTGAASHVCPTTCFNFPVYVIILSLKKTCGSVSQFSVFFFTVTEVKTFCFLENEKDDQPGKVTLSIF